MGGRTEPHDDDWAVERALIRLDANRYGPESLAGLTDFSHLEVVYLFHLVDPENVETGARRPRGNPDWPLVGIFAQRGKNRPNRLGVPGAACSESTAWTSTSPDSTRSTAHRSWTSSPTWPSSDRSASNANRRGRPN